VGKSALRRQQSLRKNTPDVRGIYVLPSGSDDMRTAEKASRMSDNSDANRRNSHANGLAVCCDQKLSSLDKKNFPWEKKNFYYEIKKFIS
jgi:hypothetical protein